MDNYWQAMARESFLDELDWQSRAICSRVVQCADLGAGSNSCLDDWFAQNSDAVGRWNAMINELRSTSVQEYAMYSVAVRGLLELARDIGE